MTCSAARARDLILTARIIESPEALRLGLVTGVAPSAELADAANALAAEIARHPAGGGAAAKRIVRTLGSPAPGVPEAGAFGDALRSDAEARNRIRAFAERKRSSYRPPAS